MTSKSKKQLQDLKEKLIGKQVKITGVEHPHRNSVGEISDIEYTPVGWGLRIELNNNLSAMVFDSSHISFI